MLLYDAHILGTYPHIPQDNSSSLDSFPIHNQPVRLTISVIGLGLNSEENRDVGANCIDQMMVQETYTCDMAKFRRSNGE